MFLEILVLYVSLHFFITHGKFHSWKVFRLEIGKYLMRICLVMATITKLTQYNIGNHNIQNCLLHLWSDDPSKEKNNNNKLNLKKKWLCTFKWLPSYGRRGQALFQKQERIQMGNHIWVRGWGNLYKCHWYIYIC